LGTEGGSAGKGVAIAIFTCTANSATGMRIVTFKSLKFLKRKIRAFENDQLISL